jgi:putative restriction endonuclease
MCGLDVGLAVAAHIVGVDVDGPDEIPNGLALCPTHHSAYDRGLLLVERDGSIRINQRRLRALGQVELKTRELRRNLSERIRYPSAEKDRPKRAYLDRHNARMR